MTLEVIIVLVALVAMLTALIMDKMRPGMILFSVSYSFVPESSVLKKCWKGSATKV